MANISIQIKNDKIYGEQNVTFTVTIIPNGDVIVLTNDLVVIIIDDDQSELTIIVLMIKWVIMYITLKLVNTCII